MSIKKLAKSINNLADAIRYHANMAANDTLLSSGRSPITGTSHGSVKGETGPQNVPKYEGKETEHCLSAVAPPPLIEAEENFVDPYDAPPPPSTDGLQLTGGGLRDILQGSMARVDAKLNDAPPPVVENDAPDFSEDTNPVDAPGWQTLTVEELDAAPSVEVDADGLPWDERIHSGGKTLLVDGTWRLKRGVPDDEYQGVVAELKKLMAIPAPVDNTPPPPPSVDAPTPPAPSASVDNLPAFIKAVTGAGIDKDVVLAAVKNAGLENVMQLGARPDLIAGIAKELGL